MNTHMFMHKHPTWLQVNLTVLPYSWAHFVVSRKRMSMSVINENT